MENVGLNFALILIIFLSINEITTASVSCTFDSGLCEWKSITSGQFKWKRGTGQTGDRLSGPLNDHTCGNYNGQYIYIPGSQSRRKDLAILETDYVTIENGTVMTFWYTMNGFGSGKLTLNALIDNKNVTLWEKIGRQKKIWIKEEVTLNPGRVKLQFQYSVRLPSASDVAIDDITLSSESQDLNKTYCSYTTTTKSSTISTTSTTTTPRTTAKNLVNTKTSIATQKTDKVSFSPTTVTQPATHAQCQANSTKGVLLPGTCDFETDTCGIRIFTGPTTKQVTWSRTNKIDGSVKDNAHVIMLDHTVGNTSDSKGYYMDFVNGPGFFWFLRNKDPDIAKMETPAIYASHLCVSFWYSMPHQYSNLKLIVKDDRYGNLTTILDSELDKVLSNTTGWHFISMAITKEPPFTIIFQTSNLYHMARVGIDDIQLLGFNISASVSTSSSGTTTTSEPSISALTESAMLTTSTSELNTSVAATLPSTTAKSSTTSTPSTTTTPRTTTKHLVNTRTSIATQKTDKVSFSSTTETSTSTTEIPGSLTRAYTTSTTEFNETSSYGVPKLISSTNFTPNTTGKGSAKKTTAATTKKPVKAELGEKDALKSENEFERTSVIVGASVGSVAAVAFLMIVLYFIVSHYRASDGRNKHFKIDEHNGQKAYPERSKDTQYHSKMNGYTHQALVVHGNCMLETICTTDQTPCSDPPMNGKLINTKPVTITHF